MTKKDYEKAAAYVRNLCRTLPMKRINEVGAAIEAFVALFEGEPRFDKLRFLAACDAYLFDAAKVKRPSIKRAS